MANSPVDDDLSYCKNSLLEPFILPRKPMILKKKKWPDSDDYHYFYFSAHHEFHKVNGDKIEKYSIRYHDIFNPPTSSLYQYGYSILIVNNNDLKLCNDAESAYRGLDVLITPSAIGIGSIILNHLFYWAKEHHPDFASPHLHLSSVDEDDLENKERRNTLYRNIGLIEKGVNKISELTPRISTKGFEVIEPSEMIKDLLNEVKKTNEVIDTLQNKILPLKKERKKYFKKYYRFQRLFYYSWFIATISLYLFFDEIKSFLFS